MSRIKMEQNSTGLYHVIQSKTCPYDWPKNRDIEIIGNNILSTLGRYDKEKKQFMPLLGQ